MLEALKQKLPGRILSENTFLGELAIEIAKENLFESFSFLLSRGYQVLMDLTGVDYIDPAPRTKIVYLLHNPLNYERIRVFIFAAREEHIPSVTQLWAGANWYERELHDLFGIQFDGHLGLKRILMPDDWKGHPLRKDYPLTEEPVEFKHGVKPKIPSEIIPHVKVSIGNTTHVKNY